MSDEAPTTNERFFAAASIFLEILVGIGLLGWASDHFKWADDILRLLLAAGPYVLVGLIFVAWRFPGPFVRPWRALARAVRHKG